MSLNIDRMRFLFVFIGFMPFNTFSQSYTAYFTGNDIDAITEPFGGICLMGGATESDQAMIWFLERANGGDVLVLRASSSDGYNDYFYSELGVSINSVETIVCHNASASNEPYLWQKIQQAEAIWFAGGDQWDYVSYWRDTPVDSLINLAIQERNIVIGGTSAGMAIQGGYYFSAENGTVTSSTALSNPYNNSVTVDSASFLTNNLLDEVITDTHFDNPDRKGRLTTFLARMYTDYGLMGKAIACDEYTAVCIDAAGIARVFGDYPSYDDNAYFVQTNCGIPDLTPEVCAVGEPLTWNLDGLALKAYNIKGTSDGDYFFDLNDWKTGSGGEWLDWSAVSGEFLEASGSEIECNPIAGLEANAATYSLFPNPTTGIVNIQSSVPLGTPVHIIVQDVYGRIISFTSVEAGRTSFILDLTSFPVGMYLITLQGLDRFAKSFPIGKVE